MYREDSCGDLRAGDAGRGVVLAGWLHRRRDHGGVTFIDLRDRTGLVQVVANPDSAPQAHRALAEARSEWVLKVVGEVRRRPAGMENAALPTGEIEVSATQVEVLNAARTPPFPIKEETGVEEMLRLRYRSLDLRREGMRRKLELRHRVARFIREFLSERGFWEVETPMLFKTTPEGARDYLVPSRLYPGEFYALPQSPQQLKQLLMVAGVERYFQIVRCFRDEDLRGDRQPEFTQLDIEMSFVEREDVMQLMEEMYTQLIREIVPHKKLQATPGPRFQDLRAGRGRGRDGARPQRTRLRRLQPGANRRVDRLRRALRRQGTGLPGPPRVRRSPVVLRQVPAGGQAARPAEPVGGRAGRPAALRRRPTPDRPGSARAVARVVGRATRSGTPACAGFF